MSTERYDDRARFPAFWCRVGYLALATSRTERTRFQLGCWGGAHTPLLMLIPFITRLVHRRSP
jgi:hypothetical protein